MIRRTFISSSLSVAAGTWLFPLVLQSMKLSKNHLLSEKVSDLAGSLLEKWCQGLYANQTNMPGDPLRDGGIYSPGDQAYLGRCADAIYPFLWMARNTGDEKYVLAARKVYSWEQNNCWNEDYGCWLNDPGKQDSWKSISVFSSITKIDSIEHYPELLGEDTIAEWKTRLHRVAEYIYNTFHIDHANINYPATATYALFKLGRMFNEEKYIIKASLIAKGIMNYFTPEGLLYGEAGRKIDSNGQYPVDLGYNVEESLPALALYSQLADDQTLSEKVLQSLKVHLEFMLPNGAWDNSWGTRSYKWTMWGSRTSDGCHPGYYHFAHKEPVFTEAVYRNLQCLASCTFDNILHSGPHEYSAKVAPSIHHTFEHAKALTALLNMKVPEQENPKVILPRQKEYGVRIFNDINTILFSNGPWRGTVTAYSVHHKNIVNGHPSGGALSCLYHSQLGMIGASSMTEYSRWEENNMLDDSKVENFMSLTPRLELVVGKESVYRNISDLSTGLTYHEIENGLIITAKSKLVNGHQENPEAGEVKASINYIVSNNSFLIEIEMNTQPPEGKLHFIFPIICSDSDKIDLSSSSFSMSNSSGSLILESNYSIQKTLPLYKRIYNFVPGLQAYPVEIDCDNLHLKKLKVKIVAI